MDIVEHLKKRESRQALINHSLVSKMRKDDLSLEQVGVVLGQWFHPLHYFPSFVSRFIGITPSMPVKTLMSKIVWQELGEGDIKRAHETLYIDTMSEAGFSNQTVAHTPAFASTARLVREYEEKSVDNHLASLGYVYATEAADLAMVSSIGSAVRRATGMKRLPWVDIHVAQEPDHTDCVDGAVAADLTSEEIEQVIAAADAMFGFWCDFFTEIEKAIAQIETNSKVA
ncbi:hypothetical protein BTO01_29155 [Vibrio jasicida]|uniref:iron-containing redox enzyme family protein n=1 Tax=Vibrio jasicida TaxID=766224 RepID=UPI000CF391E4|nr:iron-containing redox enzyme family protein [Vibrio jasicida]PQJ44594.1 hypothetical protein BTO01_29155 [Vibrio jasicida]